MNTPLHTYSDRLRDYFEARSNPGLAPGMENYMKNHFRFLGIKSPERKALLRKFIAENGHPDMEIAETVVRNLWQMPGRELHYAGMELAYNKLFLKNPCRIELIEWMITNNSWWDTADFVAANLAGLWFQYYPEKIQSVTEKWMNSGDIWLQRSCLLFQLKYRSKTDIELLCGFIEKLSGEKEFFIRKAIGWALRELSKSNPERIRVILNSIPVSNLSRKEALKHINKKIQ